MKRMFLLIYLLISHLAAIYAQNIEGRVIDTENRAVEFANIVLYSLPDSTFVKGTVTDKNGDFSLAMDGLKDAFLKISFVGYQTQTVPAVPRQTVVLKEDSNLLRGIVVKGNRNVYKIENGNIVASVKNTVLETLPNADAVISQLPFLSGQDGNFTVFGKGAPVIYINNRLLRDSKELEQLSPSDIKNIQIITIPGAKYDASVKAVIKITTEKPVGEGLSGLFYGQVRRSRVFSGKEYVSLNYRCRAWDLFGSVHYGQRRYNTDFNATQEFRAANNLQKQVYKTFEYGGYDAVIPVLGVNYTPDSRHSAGIQYTYDNTKWDSGGENFIDYSDNTHKEKVDQLANSKQPEAIHKVNAYYNGSLSDKVSLDIDFDWVKGDEKEIMDSYYAQSPNDPLKTQATRNYDLFAVKGVLSYLLGGGLLEVGGEYTYTSFLQTYNISKSGLGISNSNDKAIQNRGAAFLTYQKKLGELDIYGGIRYENIDMDYYDNNVLNMEQSKIYNQFFPNLTVSYSHGNVQASIGFERKVNYPTYGQLRSNVQYSSPFLYESGNPQLLPKIENSFTVMFAWGHLQTVAGYSINENDILSFVQQFKNKPIVLFRPENMKRTQNANIGISYAPVIGVWRPQFEVGGMWQWLNLENENVKYNKPLFSGKLNNTFSLQQDWTLRLNVAGLFGGHDGIQLMKPSWGMGLNVSKRLLKKQLTINLSVNDIFKTQKGKWEMNYGKIHLLYDKNRDTRSVSLTVTYQFNRTDSKYKGKQASDELNRL